MVRRCYRACRTRRSPTKKGRRSRGRLRRFSPRLYAAERGRVVVPCVSSAPTIDLKYSVALPTSVARLLARLGIWSPAPELAADSSSAAAAVTAEARIFALAPLRICADARNE